MIFQTRLHHDLDFLMLCVVILYTTTKPYLVIKKLFLSKSHALSLSLRSKQTIIVSTSH